MEHARLDRAQHLRRQPEQPHVRRAIARGPVPVELRHASLREHVEPEAHLVRVGVPEEPGRLAIDRELERGLDLQVRVPAHRGLEVHDDEAPVGVALHWVEGPDEVTLQHLARFLVDQRHGERLLDGDHLRARVLSDRTSPATRTGIPSTPDRFLPEEEQELEILFLHLGSRPRDPIFELGAVEVHWSASCT